MTLAAVALSVLVVSTTFCRLPVVFARSSSVIPIIAFMIVMRKQRMFRRFHWYARHAKTSFKLFHMTVPQHVRLHI
jgi:hypothetical protein